MKSNEIKELFNKFEQIACEYEGIECWSKRKEKLSRELLFVYIELERQKQLSLCQKTAVSNERIRGSGSLGGESHTAAWPFRF